MDKVRTALKRTHALVLVPARPFERLLDRRDRARRRQRLAAFVVAGAIALAAVGGATSVMTGLDRGGSWRSAAGWHPVRSLALRSDQSFYLRVESSDLGDGHVRDEETWWAPDASGEVRNRGTRLDKYPYPPSGRYARGSFPTFLAGISSLSTDPRILAGQLEEAPFDWQMLLLDAPSASPELRAAVFDVATGLDGVRVIEGVRDPAGRDAVAVAWSDDAADWRMFFDPGTHQAIAWTYRSPRGDEVWQLFESGIVDTTGERPDADQWLFPPIPAEVGELG